MIVTLHLCQAFVSPCVSRCEERRKRWLRQQKSRDEPCSTRYTKPKLEYLRGTEVFSENRAKCWGVGCGVFCTVEVLRIATGAFKPGPCGVGLGHIVQHVFDLRPQGIHTTTLCSARSQSRRFNFFIVRVESKVTWYFGKPLTDADCDL